MTGPNRCRMPTHSSFSVNYGVFDDNVCRGPNKMPLLRAKITEIFSMFPMYIRKMYLLLFDSK